MPEGPEIRYLKEVLEKDILHKSITKITAYSKKRVYVPITKSKVLQVGTKGKLLWVKTSDYYIHIHFGMTGWLYTNEEDKPEHIKYVISIGANKKVYIESIRKFTSLKLYKKDAHERKLNALGIDVLTADFTLEGFNQLVTSHKMGISKFLLDQDKICGVGNYQKSDVLYLSRIHPKANTSSLTNDQIKKLYTNIKYVAYSSLLTWLKDHKIKVPRDIKKGAPKRTKVPYTFVVYDNDKDPLGNKVTSEMVSGRRTYYVKKLQKL